jgi:hypothetical protein
MIPQAKIEAIRKYLQNEFLDYEIADTDDFERASWKFRAVKDSTIYVVKFERRFLDDTLDIGKALQRLELSKFVKENAGKQVLVRSNGLVLL